MKGVNSKIYGRKLFSSAKRDVSRHNASWSKCWISWSEKQFGKRRSGARDSGPTTTPPSFPQARTGCVALFLFGDFLVVSRLLTSMEDGSAGTSAARRRRERRLRSWWRHECQSVRMALTSAAHHSSEKVAADVKDAGLRAQTMVSAGQRPGVLTEPESQEGAVTVGYVAAPGPLLVVASLAGGDEVDATTVSYLLKAALMVKKYEEEEKERKRLERRQVLLNEFFALADVPLQHRSPQQVSRLEALAKTLDDELAAHPSQPSRRKRKKKRKKRLPRTRFLPRGFAGGAAPRVMFPSVVGRPVMLCIMADMDQKDSTLRATLAVACVSLVLLMTLHPALCSFTLSSAVLFVLLVMLGIMVGMDQKDKLLLAVACAQVVLLVTLHLALCSFPVFRPVMFGIMAGMDQKNIFALFVDNGGFTGYDTPRACSCWSVGRPVMFCIMAGICPLVCCEWRHGPDSAENCLAIPQVQLLDEIVVPVVCNDNALVLSLRTLEVPQLQFLDKVFHRCSSWTRFSCPWLWEMTGGESFSPDDAYDSALDSVMPMKGKYTINSSVPGVRCVAMSCGGESFSPDDACDSAWDSVMPTKGNTLSITSSTKTSLGV